MSSSSPWPNDGIDAVITWVDGNDPAHRAKLAAYLQRAGLAPVGAADPTRFGDCGEIDFCVASILRFAPWVRFIHIVTDNQTPALLCMLKDSPHADRVRVVDHLDIFVGLEDNLPTFSSLSIETMLWRIPDLAERFIYFNDDMFLIRPVRPEHFFRGAGVVLRGKWRRATNRDPSRRLRARLLAAAGLRPAAGSGGVVSNHAAQQNTAVLVGFDEDYFEVPHCPHPMRRSDLANFFRAFPEKLEQNTRSRLRDSHQFLLVGLSDHLQFARNAAIVENDLVTVRLKPSSQWYAMLWWQTRSADRRARATFACVQSLDAAGPRSRSLILHWLRSRIGSVERFLRGP
jgi:hypothetical protein